MKTLQLTDQELQTLYDTLERSIAIGQDMLEDAEVERRPERSECFERVVLDQLDVQDKISKALNELPQLRRSWKELMSLADLCTSVLGESVKIEVGYWNFFSTKNTELQFGFYHESSKGTTRFDTYDELEQHMRDILGDYVRKEGTQ